MLEDPVGLPKADEASIFRLLQGDGPVADVGHLDQGVSLHRLDLRRGHGQELPALKGRPGIRRIGPPHRDADDRRQKPTEPCQRQPPHLRRRSLAHIERHCGGRSRDAGKAEELIYARRAVQPQAHSTGGTTVGQPHRMRSMVGDRQPDEAAAQMPEPVELLILQALDRREQHRSLRVVTPGVRHVQWSAPLQVEQTAFRLIHASVQSLPRGPVVTAPISERTAWELVRALPRASARTTRPPGCTMITGRRSGCKSMRPVTGRPPRP